MWHNKTIHRAYPWFGTQLTHGRFPVSAQKAENIVMKGARNRAPCVPSSMVKLYYGRYIDGK